MLELNMPNIMYSRMLVGGKECGCKHLQMSAVVMNLNERERSDMRLSAAYEGGMSTW